MRADLPTGTVTFLFTDVEGSTKLLYELGAEGYATALAEHRRVLREAFALHGGVEVDTQGDAFFYAFPTAEGALEAAGEGQHALVRGSIRVRMGLHTGTPHLAEEGYVGEDVHLGARIAAAGHGGQVVVSAATAALVKAGLTDLGEHRFRDLAAAERIYQLGDERFPPLRTLPQTNLPIPPTVFLGRGRELADVCSLLARDDVRLLTLTGPGGVGKSRLAVHAAAALAERYPDGVFWIPLAGLRDSRLVNESASQIVGARDGLAAQLADRRVLLLFDNFEHVVEAAVSCLSPLLAESPMLDVLVTSREPLHLVAEHEYPVPPLAPQEGTAFFAARAQAVKPDFEVDEAVPEICRRLDELPLALELAAARVAALSTEQILARLDRRLPFLAGGARDAPERQRTLRATIEWSHDLLAGEEQHLFRRLAVFVGGCSLEAAEAVCDAGVDTLQGLVEKSLLGFTGTRYVMLETIREYAHEQLAISGEAAAVGDRHLGFFLELAETAEPLLTGPGQGEWYARLGLEEDNVRAALGHACASGDAERAAMLAGAIWRFWVTRGQIDEAAYWYDRVLALPGDLSDAARARALFGAAHVPEARGDAEAARARFGEAADTWRRMGETVWLVRALTHLAATHSDVDRIEEVQLEALRIAEQGGDRRGAALVKGNLASALIGRDDPRAARLLREALEDNRERGDTYLTAANLVDLATLDLRDDALASAAENVRESLQLSTSIGDTLRISLTLPVAAATVLARGDARAAARIGAGAEVLLRTHGIDLEAGERRLLDGTMTKARTALGDDFDAACSAGEQLDPDALVELALGALGAT